MPILYDATQTRKPSRTFGRGILPAEPRTFEPSVADRAWWAAATDEATATNAAMADREREVAFAASVAGWEPKRRSRGVALDSDEEARLFGVTGPTADDLDEYCRWVDGMNTAPADGDFD